MQFNNDKTVREIADCADRYEKALADNDVMALDNFFWDGPEVVRYGVGENLYGGEEIAAFRRARQGGSPPRTVLRRHITCIDDDIAVVSLEFRREGGQRIGRQMQTWARIDGQWKIIAAHVSLMAQQSEAAGPAAS
ncbi:MAG: oxalurate catabolism protein HpxZ [Acetobacter sp.]|uniref:oxalurate catabolism protein HpxZ n=1 Tax=Acetobacter sp. TaxID=440 RepID=UPI0039E9B746